MAKTKKSSEAKPKKQLRKEVANTLTEVFSDIKVAVGNKKFDKKVKKASKLLASGALKAKPAKEKPAAEKSKAKKESKEKKASKSSKKKDKGLKETQTGNIVPSAAAASPEVNP